MTEAIRDPVHGWIKYKSCIKKIINHPFMIRLKHCSQLGSVDQVFPGGIHNRFIHSLGVMYLARKYMKQLSKTCNLIGEDEIMLGTIAGLLHDVGHGPYSHSFDLAVYSQIYDSEVNTHYPDGGHDIHRIKIVNDPEFLNIIENCGILVSDLIAVWNAKPADGIYFLIYSIVSGPLGADRIDFVIRDSYFCGTTHLGTIAHKRIIAGVSTNVKYQLIYKISRLNDIIQALDGRRYMYHDVYFHKNAIAASILVNQFLTLAVNELDLISYTDDLEKFKWLDEETISGKIISLNESSLTRKAFINYRLRRLPEFISYTVDTEFAPGPLISESNGVITFKTRPFTGVDPKKFEYYNIKFMTKSNELVNCINALESVGVKPITPYRKIVLYKSLN
jgi:uncharacterized protein